MFPPTMVPFLVTRIALYCPKSTICALRRSKSSLAMSRGFFSQGDRLVMLVYTCPSSIRFSIHYFLSKYLIRFTYCIRPSTGLKKLFHCYRLTFGWFHHHQ